MRPSIDEVSTAFIDGLPTLTDDEQRLARAVYRLLGTGRPAPTAAIAQQGGWSPDDVEERLRTWPAVFRNDDGAVVGFWGLAAEAVTNHRVGLEGIGAAWTWCAYDTLFIPGLLDGAARVDSVCSTSGEPVRLGVSTDGVVGLDPAEWAQANPGTFWLPVAEAFEVASMVNPAVFPALVGEATR